MHRGDFDDMLTSMGSQQQQPLPQQVGNGTMSDTELNLSDLGSLADLFDDDQELSYKDFSIASNDPLVFTESEGREVLPPVVPNDGGETIGTADEGSPAVMNVADQSAPTTAAPDMSSIAASTAPMIQPTENDVLLGRGGRNNQWSGNENLRTMARQLSAAYKSAPKRNKPAIAWLLVTKVRSLKPPGRYVSMLKISQRITCIFIQYSLKTNSATHRPFL